MLKSRYNHERGFCPMTMGEYIKQLRIQHGYSQDELGKLCGVNRAAVNKWELGTVENIKRSTIKRLSEIFGVSPCELMCFDEPTEEELKIQKEVETLEKFQECFGRETLEAASLFMKLDEKDRSAVTGIIQSLLSSGKYERE